MSDFGLRFGTNSMSPMTLDEYEKLPSEEKEHFAILPSPFSVQRVANSETQRFLKLLERPAGLFLRICAELATRSSVLLGPCTTQLKFRPRVRAIGRARQGNTSDATGEAGTRRHR